MGSPDRIINITTGASRNSKNWKPKTISWLKLAETMSKPKYTGETMLEYNKMNRDDKLKTKDIGGFVGGVIDGSRRKSDAVVSRTLFTLDADYADNDLWGDFVAKIGCACLKYSTHSDRMNPGGQRRLRIVGPYDRPVTPEEHEAISRMIASMVGIDRFDDSTYQASRLMYWPSVSQDQQYDYGVHEGEALCADEILAMYGPGDTWKDASIWPVSSRVKEVRQKSAKHQGNPLEKPGIVGQFCRTYDIEGAIGAFLSDRYEPVANADDRWTYTEGSTAAGLVLYDGGMFAYSNHATDPIGGLLVNAFDLVRIHKFGSLDDGEKDYHGGSKLPSYKAMRDFALKDENVRGTILSEQIDEAAYDFVESAEQDETDTDDDSFMGQLFADLGLDSEGNEIDELLADLGLTEEDIGSGIEVGRQAKEIREADPLDELMRELEEKKAEEKADPKAYLKKLTLDKNGKIEPSAKNVLCILMHDPALKDAVKFDEFAHKISVVRNLPWRTKDWNTNWTDEDDACLRNYFGVKYGVKTRYELQDALSEITLKNRFHPVRDYLSELRWDGVGRLDSLFIDYLGAADTPYVRAATRCMMVAAINRIMKPGCKFDEMLVLAGPQGIGKTVLLSRLGGDWFSNSFRDVENKDSWMAMEGHWLIELGELRAKKRSDEDAMKNFLSKTEDVYRPAYGRYVQTYLRQSIFIGTVNDDDFLHDATGGRRYWPIACAGLPEGGTKAYNLTKEEVAQIWAEAYQLFKKDEPISLPREVYAELEETREQYTSGNDVLAIIEEYLERRVPKNWRSMSISDRKMFMSDELMDHDDTDLVYRNETCVAEIVYELYQGDMQKYRNVVAQAMKKSKKWRRGKSTFRFGCGLGTQRFYEKAEK